MKLVALISSGIDSPVAVYLSSKKSCSMILLHADNYPFTDKKECEKFIRIARHLRGIMDTELEAYILPHGITLETYLTSGGNKRFICVFCKRMMARYAEQVAKQRDADYILMGDSLGQVASQTLENIYVVEQAVHIPIIRPLIGLDKEDIIQIAKKIGTYDLSIHENTSCNATPSKPSTQAKLKDIIEEEKKINIDNLIKRVIELSRKVDI
ncbi:MAG: 7-cyano-7-deazaguanine synthase [Candidatus Thermoplasmatota archaeon]